jgi:hypothetical protein
VAVILPFTWRHPRAWSSKAFSKVLKPGVEALLEQDLNILVSFGVFLDLVCSLV